MNQAIDHLETINRFTSTANEKEGITRLAYSLEEKEAKQWLMNSCEQLGLIVREDAAGNMIARREGKDVNLPAVAFGSHIDTVYQAGRYDGALGVIAGLDVLRQLNEEGVETDHPLELIAFTCEESARFGVSTVGSKAMAQQVDKAALCSLVDKDGTTFTDALAKVDLSVDAIECAERQPEALKAFVELHIEQAKQLERQGKNIGVVTGIAAPHRLFLVVKGETSHSGTTAMEDRHDALLAAAELSLELEHQSIMEKDWNTFATVGTLHVVNGAMNTVPGRVEMKIDIRSQYVHSRNRIITKLKQKISAVQKQRGVVIDIEHEEKTQPVQMNARIRSLITAICDEKGLSHLSLPSGAGHDSMNMARRWPTAMIFVPSVDGVSHHPSEYTKEEDCLVGIEVLKETVVKLANKDVFLS